MFLEQLVALIDDSEVGTKILVFTEYRATQAYLADALERQFSPGCVDLIHGGQRHDERRAAIERFEDESQFLVSTEAGGEGINLQRQCHVMVNYDLPWNPMRLVQRIGRLYRYGQKKRVIVFNMHAPETIDADIVGMMYMRLAQVTRDMASLGGEFREGLEDDILGQMADLLELNIRDVFETAREASIERSQERIDEALRRARDAVAQQAEVFAHVSGYNPSETRDSLTIDARHLRSFVEAMCLRCDIEIVQRFHQDREWDIRLPDNVRRDCPGLGARFRVTLDRDWAVQRTSVHMLDLASPLLRYLLSRAKRLRFGGRAARVPNLGGSAFFAGVLRWQDTHAQRMRQEFLALQVAADGRVRVNSDELSNWLATPVTGRRHSSHSTDGKPLLQRAQRVTDDRLSAVSNEYLHPENRQWIAAGWLGS